MKKLLYIGLFTICSILAACGGSRTGASMAGGDTIVFKYARDISIVKYKDYTVAKIRNPWKEGMLLHTYILVPKTEKQIPYHLPEGDLIRTPIDRSVISTTAHCQLLEYLHAADAISGVFDLKYILISDIHSRVKRGKITDCGNGMSPEIEKIICLKPQALFLSPFDNSGGYGKIQTLGVPIVECADYMETSPLGRAEWMKFYGLLFGCEKRADSLFLVVSHTYNTLKRKAAGLPLGRSILTERKTGSVWYCPGGASTVGQMISDAHGRYAFAKDKHSGSLSLSFEQVLDKAGTSDVWAFKYDAPHPMTKAQLLQEYSGYTALKAFRTGEIYECNSSKVPYFEQTPFRPDFLLRDLIQMLHPGVNLGGFRFYRKLE